MARYSDDSKQGLTIALVLFVLLSIVLGLMAYFGYAEQSNLADQRDKAKARENAVSIDRDNYKMLYDVLVVANGTGTPNEVKTALQEIQGLKNRKDSAINNKPLSQNYKDELDKLSKKGLKWSDVDERPEVTYTERIAQLEKEATNATKLNVDKDSFIKKTTEDFQKDLAGMRDAKGKAELAMANTKEDVAKQIDGLDKNYKEVVKKFEENIIAAEKFEDEKAKLRKQMQEMQFKLEAALKDAELKVKRLEEKIPQIDLLAYDKPKGRITRIDINNQTAYINLGSSDLVRPGLTFSVFGMGQYRANAERKGSVEVINIIGDHLSSARITDVKSAARDPLLTGDELYNPAWSPGLREHVAVAGPIDLTGDGRDGTLEFVKNLEKQGVAVDVYLDTRDLSLKGRGMSRQTGYLIMGEVLEFGSQEQIREGDARQERKLGINAEVAKMREEAVRLGVTVIPARRFMALMGYKLPKAPAKTDDWNSFTVRQAGVSDKGAVAPPGGDKMMPKDKADMKKDAK